MEGKKTLDEEEMVKGDLLLAFFDTLRDFQDGKKTKEDFKNDLINLAISNAYDDATRQRAYNALFPKEKDCPPDLKGKKQHSKIEAAQAIKEGGKNKNADYFGINGILQYEKIDYYSWHNGLCDGLMNIYGSYELSDKFTYGNAQKWVNMTVKYLYIYSYMLENMTGFSGKNNPLKGMLNYAKDFHVPLDSYILKALFYKPRGKKSISKQINSMYRDDYHQKSKLINNEDLSFVKGDGTFIVRNEHMVTTKEWKTGEKGITWSNINDYDSYDYIQKEVVKQIPDEFSSDHLTWENKVWRYASQIIK